MSKVGKKPINIPDGVQCTIKDNNLIVKGPKGETSMELVDDVEVKFENNQVLAIPRNNSLNAKTFWGTVRSNINNNIVGVTQGFTKSLVITGVGYRMAIKGSDLVMNLGFSHEVIFPIPEGIKISCPDATHVNIEGIDKQKVGQVASQIKSTKKPEPYKGKGFKYIGEQILRKEGKKK
ncbi:50S ribosomal protein L6 [Rickettsiales bacterium LUAb2]